MSVEETYFELLGINLDSRNFRVLKALMECMSEQGSNPSFSQLEEWVNKKRRKPFTKQWIYKCLSDLEQDKFITVHRIQKPITYSTSLIDFREGIDRLYHRAIENLTSRQEKLKKELENIQKLNVYDLAYALVNRFSKGRTMARSGVIEGMDNIRSVLLFELCEQAKAGDIIRVSNRVTSVASDDERIPLDRLILRTTRKGVRIRVVIQEESVMNPDRREDYNTIIALEADTLLEALSSGLLEIKVTSSGIPYRILAMNSEKLFLFVSDSDNPDELAYLRREDNPLFFDTIIEKFDSIFNEATLLNDILIESISGRF